MADTETGDSRIGGADGGGTPAQTHVDIDSVSKELLEAARSLRTAVAKLRERPKRGNPINVTTFAAYEACREDVKRDGWIVNALYLLLIVVTLTSAVWVARTPVAVQPIWWDAVGLGSTMFLLYLTYGVYTARLSYRIIYLLLDMLSPWASRYLPEPRPSGDDRDGNDALEPMMALALLIAGSVVAYYAVWNLIELGQIAQSVHERSSAHLDDLMRIYNGIAARSDVGEELKRVAQSTHERAHYNWVYAAYFWKIGALAFLFVLMDLSVARFNSSHADSYIAASSAVFVTIPMAIGISLIGAYLFVEYHFAQGAGVAEPYSRLSVEFASGAFTFQMILSNTIFVAMKKNWVFGLLYSSVTTTTRP